MDFQLNVTRKIPDLQLCWKLKITNKQNAPLQTHLPDSSQLMFEKVYTLCVYKLQVATEGVVVSNNTAWLASQF